MLTVSLLLIGILSFLQEVLGSNIAGVPIARPAKDASPIAHLLAAARINVKALNIAIYGAFISAPMSHYLVGSLQKLFAGKTSAGARIAQILLHNIFVAPIQSRPSSDLYSCDCGLTLAL